MRSEAGTDFPSRQGRWLQVGEFKSVDFYKKLEYLEFKLVDFDIFRYGFLHKLMGSARHGYKEWIGMAHVPGSQAWQIHCVGRFSMQAMAQRPGLKRISVGQKYDVYEMGSASFSEIRNNFSGSNTDLSLFFDFFAATLGVHGLVVLIDVNSLLETCETPCLLEVDAIRLQRGRERLTGYLGHLGTNTTDHCRFRVLVCHPFYFNQSSLVILVLF